MPHTDLVVSCVVAPDNGKTNPKSDPIALPDRKAAKVDARDLYILRPELVGAAMATDRDRLGLSNKGQGGG